MPTGQVIVSNALTILGMMDPGGVPSVSDSNYGLSQLNNMWAAWGVDEGLIYAVISATFPLSANVGTYTIGTGATFSTPRPARIYAAYLVATVGAKSNRNELEIVEASRYYRHNDLAAAAAVPDELYPDYNVDGSGYASLNLWPVPTCPTASSLELEMAATFTAWTLAANYQLPQGYQDPLEYALAFRMMAGFGAAVNQQVAALVAELGAKAEERIRTMNAFNRKLPAPMEAPGTQKPQAVQ